MRGAREEEWTGGATTPQPIHPIRTVILPFPDPPIRSKIDRMANPEDAGIVPGASETVATADPLRCTLDHPRTDAPELAEFGP